MTHSFRRFVIRTSRIVAMVLLCALAGAGCSREEPIVKYVVPEPYDFSNEVVEHSEPTEAPDRLLGAMTEHDGWIWFFKLAGPRELVDAEAERFREFVVSVKFEGRQPVWQVPEGWEELPGTGMRYATFRIRTQRRPLDLSVIPLRGSIRGDNRTVLDNVNRWRGQMGLPAVSKERLQQTTRVEKNNGREIILVDLKGTYRPGSMSMAPFAGG